MVEADPPQGEPSAASTTAVSNAEAEEEEMENNSVKAEIAPLELIDVTKTRIVKPTEPLASPFSRPPAMPKLPPFRPMERICIIIGNSDYKILRAQPCFHKFCDLPEVKADVKNFYISNFT